MSDTPTPSTQKPRAILTEDKDRLWATYEEIAMHVNDLVMRWAELSLRARFILFTTRYC